MIVQIVLNAVTMSSALITALLRHKKPISDKRTKVYR